MRIALISLNPEYNNSVNNMQACRRLLDSINEEKVDICIFPENTLTGFCFTSAHEIAEDLEKNRIIEFFSSLARNNSTFIIFGTFAYDRNRVNVRNSAFALNRNGEIIGRYDKLHVFSPGGESKYVTQGDSLCFFEVHGINLGLVICYDLRFPELYHALSKNCSVIVNIANWPSTRSDHWLSLLKARAIEQQIFTVGVNRSGSDSDGVLFMGDSVVFDPYGKKSSPKVVKGEVQIFELDIDQVRNIQRRFDMKSDHRFKVIFQK